MRLDSSIKNLSTAWMSQLLLLILKFINRTFFVYYLGAEYLGVNGLFSNILSMLSLADLGIGSAIVYSLYKPIANEDIKEMTALMQLFKKVYACVGGFILIVGCCLTPFLESFIKDVPDGIDNLNIIFILFVVNTGISYFYSYKSSFIIANQKNYIVTLNHIIFVTICSVLQIIVLIITRNFLIYLSIQIIITFIENFVISKISNGMYPFLKKKDKVPLDKLTQKEIIKNTSAMIFHKLGSIIVFSTDNLVLSKIVGLVSVGIYSNYSLVIGSIENIIFQIFNSITASVGNLRVTESIDKQKSIFNTLFFINFWIYAICTSCLFNLLNIFINMWIGKEYLFVNTIVMVLVLNFYLSGMRKSVLTFKDAFGLFWQNRYMPIFESLINVVLSIFLAKRFGAIGVFLGTTFSTLLISFWVEPLVLYRYGFKSKMKTYFYKYILYFIVAIVICGITTYVNAFINVDGVIAFIIKGIIAFIIPNIVIYICFHHSDEYKKVLMYINKILNTIKKRVSKSRKDD